MLNFIKAIIASNELGGIGLYDSNAAVVTFGNSANSHILLNQYMDETLLQQAVDAIPYGMGTTKSDLGLELTYSTTFTAANGDRSNHPNVCLFVTDGRSVDTSATQVQSIPFLAVCQLVSCSRFLSSVNVVIKLGFFQTVKQDNQQVL